MVHFTSAFYRIHQPSLKFDVTIIGCPDSCTHPETQDIGMTPAVRSSDGADGFNVKAGGKMGSGGMTVGQTTGEGRAGR